MKNYKTTLSTKILTIISIILLALYAAWGTWGAVWRYAYATDPPSSTIEVKSPPAWPIDAEEFPAVAIKSVNPGYNSNTGELVELVRLSDDSIDLSGVQLRYFNKSGTEATLYTFPAGSQMVAETIVLRYSGSAEAKETQEFDATYKKTLAFEAGPLQLVYEEKVFDSLCWLGGDDCYPVFKSKTPTTLVRDLETGVFSHVDIEEYEASFSSGLFIETIPEPVLEPQCTGLAFSEILTYYETDPSEQFIELYNSSDDRIPLDGCTISYKNKSINLTGTLESSSFTVVRPDFTLTKNPSTSNTFEIVDINGDTVDKLVVEHGQKKAAALAQFGYEESGAETWQQTYQQTPGEQNLYQEYKSCEAGKVINPETGNCVKASSLASTVTACKEGQYRNPETGRCKSIQTSSTTECKEGYERNPETNRCRKITTNTGANYGIETREYEQKSVFMALGAVIIIVIAGVAYIIFQFRKEIAEFIDKIWRKLTGKPPKVAKSKESTPVAEKSNTTKFRQKITTLKRKIKPKPEAKPHNSPPEP